MWSTYGIFEYYLIKRFWLLYGQCRFEGFLTASMSPVRLFYVVWYSRQSHHVVAVSNGWERITLGFPHKNVNSPHENRMERKIAQNVLALSPWHPFSRRILNRSRQYYCSVANTSEGFADYENLRTIMILLDFSLSCSTEGFLISYEYDIL